MIKDFFSNSDVGEKHEFFDEIVGFEHIVERNVGWIVSFVIKGEFDLSRSEGQGTVLNTSLSEDFSNAIESSNRFGKLGMVFLIVKSLLGLFIGQRGLGKNNRFEKVDFHDFGVIGHFPNN